MPRKSPTLFTIGIPITRRMMEQAANDSFADLDGHTRAIVRKAGVNRKHLTEALINDELFRTNVGKKLIEAAEFGIQSALDYGNFACIADCEHPLIRAAVRALDEAEEICSKDAEARERANRIRDAKILLVEAGYEVIES